ncbi:MAG: YitT family protein [Erysipelotrichaceae bacterium]
MFINKIFENKNARFVRSLVMIIFAGFLQATIIRVFMNPLNLLPSGFTGIAILIEKVTSNFLGFSFSTSLGMLALNIPIAIFCSRTISKRFTILSLIEVFASSFFLQFCNFKPVFDDPVLNIIYGGFLYGIMVVITLKANGSTGGTDFIALYISNKKGKAIWTYIFVFNTIILLIFGWMFGFKYAGYSIIFQLISTKTIDSFYTRYQRMTMQITTEKPQEIIDAYVREYRHGISVVEAKGGFSHQKMYLMHTVVSSYEVQDITRLMSDVDNRVIINVFKTESFYGGFYIKPIE